VGQRTSDATSNGSSPSSTFLRLRTFTTHAVHATHAHTAWRGDTSAQLLLRLIAQHQVCGSDMRAVTAL
jgi:hypothetical protein